MLIGTTALALACGQAKETADAAAGAPKTFNEAAGELESDVAAGVDAAAQAGQDATDEAKKDAAEAIEEGIKTQ